MSTNSTLLNTKFSKILNNITVVKNATYPYNITREILNNSIIKNATYQHKINSYNNSITPITPNEFSILELKDYVTYIIPLIMILLIIVGIIKYIQIGIIKNKLKIPMWIKNLYNSKEDLPIYNNNKVKQSPFIGPEQPQIIPPYIRLQNSKKQKNLRFQFNIPYQPFQTTKSKIHNEEHRITITTVLQELNKV
jgi:hypothetical protein